MKPTDSPTTAAKSRDYAAIALAYARAAAESKPADKRFCKWTRLAAARHLADLKKYGKRRAPLRFDAWHAGDVCDFIEKLPHVEGEWGSATIRLDPSQIFILCVVFGWRRDDGRRRFTHVYIEMARKNAKSTLTAGIALYALCCENELGPQVIIGATTGEQAGKVFKPAQKMVERTSDLRDAFGLAAWTRSISCSNNGGFIQPINAKSSTQDGWNPHCGILDEVHAHKDRGLYDVIRSAFGARKNPLLWLITTAGDNLNGVCYEQRTLVTKILEGLVEAEHYFGIIYTLDEGDDPFEEACWGKANPLLGVSVNLEELKSYAVEAQNSPQTLNEFKTKRLNVWVGAKAGHVNMEKWRKCKGEVDPAALRTMPCFGGLDLAAVSDLCAFALAWKVGDRIKCKLKYYLPEETVNAISRDRNVPYRHWQEKGLLTLTPGNVVDYAYIRADILQAMKDYKLQALGYDPYNAQETVNILTEDGVPLKEFRQGIRSFNAPMKELDRLYLAGLLDHAGDPVLAWHASNVVARRDVNDNIAPSKEASMEKIDGYVALLMALGVMMSETAPASVYETRGVLTL